MFRRKRRGAARLLRPRREPTVEEWTAHERRERQRGRYRYRSSDGYYTCSHQGCNRKVNSRAQVNDHDCCGSVEHDAAHAYWERDGQP